jgi:hypothetical protein
MLLRRDGGRSTVCTGREVDGTPPGRPWVPPGAHIPCGLAAQAMIRPPTRAAWALPPSPGAPAAAHSSWVGPLTAARPPSPSSWIPAAARPPTSVYGPAWRSRWLWMGRHAPRAGWQQQRPSTEGARPPAARRRQQPAHSCRAAGGRTRPAGPLRPPCGPQTRPGAPGRGAPTSRTPTQQRPPTSRTPPTAASRRHLSARSQAAAAADGQPGGPCSQAAPPRTVWGRASCGSAFSCTGSLLRRCGQLRGAVERSPRVAAAQPSESVSE